MKTSRKRRRRSSSEDRRPRRYRSGSKEPARKGNKTKRKRTPQEGSTAAPLTQVCPSPPQPEESGASVRELLSDRERLLEHLFRSVAPETLRRIMPPRLQGRSTEDLKRPCLLQLRLMSEECVLDIAAGKDPSLLVPAVEEESVDQTEDGSADKSAQEVAERVAETPSRGGAPSTRGGAGLSTRSCNVPSPEKTTTASSSSSPLDHHLLLADTEMQTVVGEENLVPPAPEDGDRELLELEMRARAIRALLRARSDRPPP